MKFTRALILILSVVVCTGCMTAKGNTVTARHETIQTMKTETLDDLYAKVPESKGKMDRAVGYGVFKQIGAAFLVAGTSNGFGSIIDTDTGSETYMRAATGSLGFGFGIKNYRMVIIFYDPAVMDKFVNVGWDFGASASATLKSDEQGGDAVATGTTTRSMDIYEFTKEGIFLRADLKATRMWPDKNLNIE